MKQLSEPSIALANRALQEVDFDDRLIGYRHQMRLGATPVTLYSFGEVIGLLADSVPQIDSVELEIWIRDVIGDRELADLIQETGRSDLADVPKCKKIAELMAKRFFQYQRASSLIG